MDKLVILILGFILACMCNGEGEDIAKDGQGFVSWRRYKGKSSDNTAISDEKLSEEKRMLLIQLKDLLEKSINNDAENSVEATDKNPSIVKKQTSAALPWKRAPQTDVAPGIPWSSHKRESSQSTDKRIVNAENLEKRQMSSLPWKRQKSEQQNNEIEKPWKRQMASLPWKRQKSEQQNKEIEKPWKRQSLPWKRQSPVAKRSEEYKRELYDRLIRDVNELFTLEDHTGDDERMEKEILEVEQLTSDFNRMA